MLNQEQFQAKWKEINAGIRNLWGNISDEELEEFKGNISEISGVVEQRHHESKEEIKAKLKDLFDSFENDTDRGISPDHSSYMRSPLGEPGLFDQTQQLD